MSQTPDRDGLFDHSEAEWQAIRRDPDALLAWMDHVVSAIHDKVVTPLRQAKLVSMPPVATGASRLPIVGLVPPPSHPPLPKGVASLPVVRESVMPPDTPPTPAVDASTKGPGTPPVKGPSPWFQVSDPERHTNRHQGLITRPVSSSAPSVSSATESGFPPREAINGSTLRDESVNQYKSPSSPFSPSDPVGSSPSPVDEVPLAPLPQQPPDTGLPLPSEIRSRKVDEQRRKRVEASIQDALKKNKGIIQ